MKKVCIFVFSGTGITKYVVDKMKSEFEKHQVYVDVFCIENFQAQDFLYTQYDSVGIAYPVHSFNAPEIMVKFARRLPRVNNMDTFIISTAGGSSSLSFASSDLLIKTIEKKGFSVYYEKQFIMPSNFIVKDSEDMVKDKIDRVNIEIPKAVYEIINRVSHKVKSKFITKIIAFLGRAEWYGVKCVKFFYADASCNHCGICVEKCPNHNITMKEDHVIFKRKCGLCMRCLYLCPRQSIRIRWPYKFIGFENWYEDVFFS